jgi:UDP-N-acetyl-D-mannosaminuronate dehydrogenase
MSGHAPMKGQLFVLESTTYPATREVMVLMLE